MENYPSKVLMIRPVLFGYNEQTAASNSFQNSKLNENETYIQGQALIEFNTFSEKLRFEGIDVIEFEDTEKPHTPDSIFPNNWISFHEDNLIVLYPMLAENRRLERRNETIDFFKNEKTQVIDFSSFEKENKFLEGTGSIVFDYTNKVAYANVSPRTDKKLLQQLCEKLNYQCVVFAAVDNEGKDIYHTNVLMCVGATFAVICTECIKDSKNVIQSLKKSNKELIEITCAQMNSFAGNMYQLFNDKNESIIVMSEQAFKSLNEIQINEIQKHGKILHSPLYTIEKYGGGSARCMIADIRN